MFLPVATILLMMAVLPGVLIVALMRSREATRLEWLVKTLYTGAYVAYVWIIGRWDWVSVYLRWLWPALFLFAAVIAYRRVRVWDTPAGEGSGQRAGAHQEVWHRMRSSLFVLGLFLLFVAIALRGYFFPADGVRMAFPLADGHYYVAQGGNSTLVNYHNSYAPQRHALDVVALNDWGTRASGLYPRVLERYAVYDTPLYAPCGGDVIAAVDGLPDQIPPAMDAENPPGNHVIIACDGADVLLAHMRSGSLLVGDGDTVQTGYPLGRVGNSGNSSEPHLHIHASQPGSAGAGEGIPILFEDGYLVRNAVMRR